MFVCRAGVDRPGEPIAPLPGGTVTTIGVYDGVHLGHRAVLSQVCVLAAEIGAASAVVTFDPHPAAVVRPASAPRYITDLEQRLALIEEAGIEYAYVVLFDLAAAAETATDFVRRVLVRSMRARAVVVGDDFHFGHNRGGNVRLLNELGPAEGFGVRPVSLIGDVLGPVYSSTEIRRALTDGRVADAARMLGRPFEVEAGEFSVERAPVGGSRAVVSLHERPGRVHVATGLYEADIDPVSGAARLTERAR
jgi:riboflavin kinase/FMN adenylyltransferase